MSLTSSNEEGQSRRKTSALILVIVAAGAASLWLVAFRGGDELTAVPAVCTECGDEQTVEVGEAPGLEEWPRECPKCGAKNLYMARECPNCRRLIPYKDPEAEKFGIPELCPFCNQSALGD